MAEISNSSGTTGGRRKNFSTRVDLTPMVDLGFLLITFFVFTTSISSPTSIKLFLPDDREVETATTTAEGKTVTLLLGEHNNIYYYRGFPGANVSVTRYESNGIRSVLSSIMNDVARKYGDRSETTVIIKPTAKSSYKNVVDILDEMLINGVERYAVVDVDAKELKMMNN